MNIALISPYQTFTPIGLRIISACLKRANHKVRIIFVFPKLLERINVHFSKKYFYKKQYSHKTLKQLVNFCKECDLIGISLSTNYLPEAIQITKFFKKNTNIPIIWGGIHPTVKPKECLNFTDMVCIGEGEEAIVELAEKLERGQDWTKVRNIGFKDKKGNIILNPVRPLIQDLDSLPFQDYDFQNEYLVHEDKIYSLSDIFFNKISPFYYREEFYRTIFTRGCPFNCSYCCNYFLNKLYRDQKNFRKRSVDNVIAELKWVKENLDFFFEDNNLIWFEDDHFLGLSLKEIKEFSEKFKKEINKNFVISGGNPYYITKEKLELLVNAGLVGIRMGIQTASEKTKKLYNRIIPNKVVENAANIINQFKEIKYPSYDVILDNPFETEDDLSATLKFLIKLPSPFKLILFSLTFFPGTKIYQLAKKRGLIKDEIKDVCRKNYWKIKKNYYNDLFFLFKEYAIFGKRISSFLIKILTNKFFIKIKISFILLYFLKIKIKIIKIFSKISYYFKKSKRLLLILLLKKLLQKVNFIKILSKKIQGKIELFVESLDPRLEVTIGLTYSCQLNCVHCGMKIYKNNPEREISTKKWIQFINSLSNEEIKGLLFFGGEPLLREDIFRLIEEVKKRGIRTRLDTNGYLLSKEIVKKLKKSGLDIIEISIDHYNPLIHNELRGKKQVFERAIEGIKNCVNEKIITVISTYATREYIQDGTIKKIISLGENLSVQLIRILYPVLTGKWLNKEKIRLQKEEFKKLKKIVKQSKIPIFLEGENCFSLRKKSIYISPYGDVQPCPYIPFTFGNIKEESFKKIIERMWRHPIFKIKTKNCLMNEEKLRKKYLYNLKENQEFPIPLC